MVVIKIPKESSLRLKFSLGLDGKGNEIVKSKTFSNIKNTSADEDVHAVAKGISELCKYTLMEISRQDNGIISE